MPRPPSLAVLGQCTTDFFGAGVRLSELQTTNELSQVSVHVGGPAAVAAVTAARLGCELKVCTKVTDDFLGRYILGALRSAGIDTSLAVSGAGHMSPFSFTAVDPSGERTSFRAHGDVPPLEAREVQIDLLLEGASALLLDGSEPRCQATVAELAGARDIPVVLDAGDLREGTGELVALADVFISSERLASEIAPRGELQDSLIELQQLGPRSVIITMGEGGSIGLHDDQLVQQPPYPITRIADTSGAGSVYHGAFATALAHGDDFARCMQFASIAAGLSCSELGALAGLPGRDDVLARME